MDIVQYVSQYEPILHNLIIAQGEDWSDYTLGENRQKYANALEKSIVYLVIQDGECVGYVRCVNDFGYGIYIYDLLVHEKARGNHLGKQLMERVKQDYPNDVVYVMSDVDEYYQKLGYAVEGSIFVVTTDIREQREQK
jgi:ribosomal protein S18 acetylase RimI-like enzyme